VFPKSKLAAAEREILKFINDKKAPLLLRSGSKTTSRGSRIKHRKSSRYLVFTDNTPAHWIVEAVRNKKGRLTKNFIARELGKDRIPVALALSRNEKKKAKHKCVARPAYLYENKLKLCHFEEVSGRQGRLDWKNHDIEELKQRSYRFLSPLNMFVVRNDKHYTQGLGENEIFIDELQRLLGRRKADRSR
jgi:hypothetical protein